MNSIHGADVSVTSANLAGQPGKSMCRVRLALAASPRHDPPRHSTASPLAQLAQLAVQPAALLPLPYPCLLLLPHPSRATRSMLRLEENPSSFLPFHFSQHADTPSQAAHLHDAPSQATLSTLLHHPASSASTCCFPCHKQHGGSPSSSFLPLQPAGKLRALEPSMVKVEMLPLCSAPVQPNNAEAAPSTPAGWLSGPSVRIITGNEHQTGKPPGFHTAFRRTRCQQQTPVLTAERHPRHPAENHKTQVQVPLTFTLARISFSCPGAFLLWPDLK